MAPNAFAANTWSIGFDRAALAAQAGWTIVKAINGYTLCLRMWSRSTDFGRQNVRMAAIRLVQNGVAARV
jgi:hypothetical protein